MTALPSIYGISAASLYDSIDEFLTRLEAVLAEGKLSLLQVRDKQFKPSERATYAQECIARCKSYGCQVLINDDPELADRLNADGTHVSSTKLEYWQPDQLYGTIGFSAHNQHELACGFETIHADFAVLSPVLTTLTHVDAQPLGWASFKQLVASCSRPVYALGGIQLAQLDLARRHGAVGIASMRSLWQSPPPIATAGN